jgi:hypothetical protein
MLYHQKFQVECNWNCITLNIKGIKHHRNIFSVTIKTDIKNDIKKGDDYMCYVNQAKNNTCRSR